MQWYVCAVLASNSNWSVSIVVSFCLEVESCMKQWMYMNVGIDGEVQGY